MTTLRAPSPVGLPVASSPPRATVDAYLERDTTVAHTLEVGVPMRDGARLAADVHLPTVAHRPAPAVVLGTPYDKSGPGSLEAGVYQAAGFALVVYDCRGRGKSEGRFRMFAHDAQDGHDVVEWVAAQPWCTGAVGVTGLSYGGWVTWATASQHPPHLRAMVSTSAAGRWMQEVPATWGCFQLYNAGWSASLSGRLMDTGRFDVREALRTLPIADIGRLIDGETSLWRDMLDHDTLDAFWQDLRLDDRYAELDVPVLHVTGWHDREDLQGAFHHYEHMASREAQWLLVGPWSHVGSRWPARETGGVTYDASAAVDMHAVHLRFFERFLRGDVNGWDDEPRVRLFDTGADGWTGATAWTPGPIERVLLPTGDGGLDDGPVDDGERSYRYDPLDPPTLDFDVERLWEPPLDVGPLAERDDVLSFDSARLAAPLTVQGWSFLDLLATTDGDDTDWFVVLSDLGEDGRSLRVAGGCLRASHSGSLSNPQPVPAGVAVRYRVELTPALHTFRTGHRLRLLITSADFPWFARNLNRFGPIGAQADPRVALNTVHLGAGATRLRLSTKETS